MRYKTCNNYCGPDCVFTFGITLKLSQRPSVSRASLRSHPLPGNGFSVRFSFLFLQLSLRKPRRRNVLDDERESKRAYICIITAIGRNDALWLDKRQQLLNIFKGMFTSARPKTTMIAVRRWNESSSTR